LTITLLPNDALNKTRILDELVKCDADLVYFVATYCHIYNATERAWMPFRLWDAQRNTLTTIHGQALTVVLKARQLGLSWLVLCYALWLMLFRPAATVLLFSKRDEEAIELLDVRLKGIYERLPSWMQCRAVRASDKHNWQLSNGSRAQAFPTTGGRSYTGTLAIVDEADFVSDLDELLNAVKPTIDAGGQMVMVSSVDKSQPRSAFKRIYEGAGQTDWRALFLPWSARPGRDSAWYEGIKADIMIRTGALDDLWQEYPSTPEEALAPRTLDKRIPAIWLLQCYQKQEALSLDSLPDAPSIPGLAVYAPPIQGRRYVIGADPAEGNPTSDDSALTVLDAASGEEAASLAGKFQPSTFAGYIDAIGRYFNNAGALVERNNHGHAVLLWLKDHSRLARLPGLDGAEGWHSTTKGKTIMYDAATDAFRHQETTLHSFATYMQLASIEGSTLRAPNNEHDDRADSYALAVSAAQVRSIARSLGVVAQGTSKGWSRAV